MSSIMCNFCNKTFSTISSLNKHKETAAYCVKIQNNFDNFHCNLCPKKFSTKKLLEKHTEECKQDLHDLELTRYKILLEMKEKEFENYKTEKESQIKKLEDMLEKANITISDIAKQPKTINTTVRGDQNIQNILSDYSAYKEYTSYDRIFSIAKDDKDFDKKYFDKGQAGIAQFVCDRIVNTEDGKMIICCTDPNRKRFKYQSKKNGITDDIEARHLTKKIAKPIKDVCQIVHQNIQRELDTTDNIDKFVIDNRREWSCEQLGQISLIDDNKRNQIYKRELSILLSRKSPQENENNNKDEVKDNIE